MKPDYSAIPIPAYDVDGRLIEPDRYSELLQGATVEVEFNLLHWAFAAKTGEPARDAFVAEIERLRVLDPPKPFVYSPRKRKAQLMGPVETQSK